MSSCVVEARSVTKDFKVAQKAGGRLSTLRHLVRRRYRRVRAVDEVSFSIHTGERVAVLGANGAGKTTLVKLMCGLLRPTAGRVELLGTEPIRRELAVRRSTTFWAAITRTAWDATRRWCSPRRSPTSPA